MRPPWPAKTAQRATAIERRLFWMPSSLDLDLARNLDLLDAWSLQSKSKIMIMIMNKNRA
jgi:hypothetical protein